MNGLPGIKGDMVGFVSCIRVISSQFCENGSSQRLYTVEVLLEVWVTLPTASWVEFTG